MNALDAKLITFNKGTTDEGFWTATHAVEGVQIFGGIGSGKTSGSGRYLALKYLKAGYGGLVLTVKPEEKDMWVEYCKEAGRDNKDLIVIEPGGKNIFNFLEYESSNSEATAITENLVQVLKTVIRAGEDKAHGASDDPFWESALDMLIFNCIDLLKLADQKVSIKALYDIVQHLPGPDGKKNSKDPFGRAFSAAKDIIMSQALEWENNQSKEWLNKLERWQYDEELGKVVPKYLLLKVIDQFINGTFRTLNEKTRSIIEFSFSSFLFRLQREPIFSLFCNGITNAKPELSMDGKIILINLPVKIYHKVGRDCQILYKYCWQRAMEKRKVTDETLPVFLWADEAQNFLHEYDADYQATARSSRIATVYLSQNLPNYYANMGGGKSEFRVKSFLGTLGTKIFHANGDIETNKYASDLIGERYVKHNVPTYSDKEDGGASFTENLKLEKYVRPEQFGQLRSGGRQNNGKVDAYFHFQSRVIPSLNHTKKMISQPDFSSTKPISNEK